MLAGPLGLIGRGGPRPTPRTLQLLRRYDLVGRQQEQPQVALASLQQEIAADPNPDNICSFAELAYLEGQRLQTAKNNKAALEFYGAAVAHAYWYLLDPQPRSVPQSVRSAVPPGVRPVQRVARIGHADRQSRSKD